VFATVGDGDGVGGIGDGVRLGKGGRVIVAEGDISAVWGISMGITVVLAPWQAVRSKIRVIQNFFPISFYRKARIIRG
jgi:hypothetical protein